MIDPSPPDEATRLDRQLPASSFATPTRAARTVIPVSSTSPWLRAASANILPNTLHHLNGPTQDTCFCPHGFTHTLNRQCF
jgi:hypothetical protein